MANIFGSIFKPVQRGIVDVNYSTAVVNVDIAITAVVTSKCIVLINGAYNTGGGENSVVGGVNYSFPSSTILRLSSAYLIFSSSAANKINWQIWEWN